MTTSADRTAILRYLDEQMGPDAVIEVRILKASDNPRYPEFTLSGYFHPSRRDDLVDAVLEWDGEAEGIYATINGVKPDLLARASNRLVKKPKHTTSDTEILRRTTLVFDSDPKRPAGVSSTDAEKALAWERIHELKAYLRSLGWPEPIVADSGNGYHLVCRIDLANNEGATELVERVLKAADHRFSDDQVQIDPELFNAARICKLYETWARKGDSTDDRPHRRSHVISIPDVLHVVPVEMLEKFAAEFQPDTPTAQPRAGAFTRISSNGVSPESRARGYLFSAGFPESVAGDNGHGALYRAACELVDGFGLDRCSALPILREYNQTKARPPESEKQVAHKLDDAIKNHPHPSLKRLNADRNGACHVNHVNHVHVEEEELPPVPAPEWPDPPVAEAYHGLAGEIVRAVEPHSEADPAAMLFQLLGAFGSIVDRRRYVRVGGARHHCNENVLIVGDSSAARKGTSWADISPFAEMADEAWRRTRVLNGLSSGEGLIHAVRDPLEVTSSDGSTGRTGGRWGRSKCSRPSASWRSRRRPCRPSPAP